MARDNGLMIRIHNCASNEGKTLDELAAMSDRALMRIPNFGRKSIDLLRQTTGVPNPRPNKFCTHCGALLVEESD